MATKSHFDALSLIKASICGFKDLLYVLRKILDATGYSYDITRLENSEFANLVIFNTFPAAWELDEYGLCLPHWTVTEFLEQLELFCAGQFTIDSHAQTITYETNRNALLSAKTVVLDKVLDAYSVEIEDEEDVNDTYIQQRNLQYSECDHNMQKYYSCEWAKNQLGVITFEKYGLLLMAVNDYLAPVGSYPNHEYYRKLLYAADMDTYFVLQCYKIEKVGASYRHLMRVLPVNIFGPRTTKEDSESTEIAIVPVCVDNVDETHGDMVFLECGTYGDSSDDDENQSMAVNVLIDGEKDKEEEYYDKLYVGFWEDACSMMETYYPIPYTDNYVYGIDNSVTKTMRGDYSMRLVGTMWATRRSGGYTIDQSRKYTFSFLADTIPDPKAVFHIQGKRYVCQKITATFNEDTGMSKKMKGIFYRIEE